MSRSNARKGRRAARSTRSVNAAAFNKSVPAKPDQCQQKRPLPARESRIETRERLPPERLVEINPRAERNELATARPFARVDQDVVSSATLSKCSTPGMVQTRPASENSVARPEG